MDFDGLLNALKSKNTNGLKEILSSDSAKRAINSAMTQERAKSALNDAKSGNTEAAKEILARLIATPDGKALVARILANLGDTNG